MAMWEATSWTLPGGSRHITLGSGGRPLQFDEVIQRWCADAAFRDFFSNTLAAAAMVAWFWEMPPLTAANLQRPFECVQVPADQLAAVRADAAPFAEAFATCRGCEVVAFPNLGGDAKLVVPCPLAGEAVYAHIGSFVRAAPRRQRDALWRKLGEAVRVSLGVAPLWVSTSGLGVHWVHVRLDSRPKYYTHAPYRRLAGG